MYYQRAYLDRFLSLLAHFPAVAVTGARQVGKSTFVEKTLAGKAEFVVFDPVVDVENARQDPELFLDNHATPLVLDEIQYAPELLPPLKRRIDRDSTPGQYILTGSQQWGVMKSISESMAGRVVFLDMDGFSSLEIARKPFSEHWIHFWLDSPEKVVQGKVDRVASDQTLYDRLWRGFLPEAHFLPTENVSDFLTAYQRTYIERDARLMADVSDWQQFGRFMRLVAALTGQEINYSQMGREIGISPQTAQRWLDVLKATFQWYELPAYSGNAIKRISGKPKGHVADSGVACWSLAISTPRSVASHPNWGALFETMVYGEIRKAVSLLSPPPNMYHWRTHGGAEVDLVLERDGTFHPIEIKSKSRPTRNDTRGITAFRQTYPNLRIAKGLVVAPSESMYPLTELDYAMPWDALFEA